MAARRGGFLQFFDPLFNVDKFRTGLRDGTLTGIDFFAKQVLPLVHALKSDDKFSTLRILKKYHPTLSDKEVHQNLLTIEEIRNVQKSVQSMFSLWDNSADPVLIDVLKAVYKEKLFDIPEVFAPVLSTDEGPTIVLNPVTEDLENDRNPEVDAWRSALSVEFSQFEKYVHYISDKSRFGTHQGIRGLQFPRVMVVIADSEARGFMFSHDILLGAKDTTPKDKQRCLEGKDTIEDRTRRLFYVTCSRAQQSLAVIVYSKGITYLNYQNKYTCSLSVNLKFVHQIFHTSITFNQITVAA